MEELIDMKKIKLTRSEKRQAIKTALGDIGILFLCLGLIALIFTIYIG